MTTTTPERESGEGKEGKSLPVYWADFLLAEFAKETDRAAIILTASLFENALEILLKVYLVPSSGNADELFEGPTAPLAQFSSRIHMAHRLGLISHRFTQNLHLIRKIRNEFAHNVHGSSLEDGKLKDLLTNLVCSSAIVANEKAGGISIYPDGPRGEFLAVANIMLFHIHQKIERISSIQLREAKEEWIFSFDPREHKDVSDSNKVVAEPPQRAENSKKSGESDENI